jgi:hypothetical protein
LDQDDLHCLDDNIAVLQARERKLFRELKEVKPPPYGKAIDCLVDYEAALEGGSRDDKAKALRKLKRVLRQGADAATKADAIWDKVDNTTALKAKLIEKEHGRQIDLGQFIPAEKMIVAVMAIMEIVKQEAEHELGDIDKARRVVSRVARKVNSMIPTTQADCAGEVSYAE